MKKVALVGFIGLMVSGCTVTTVQTTGPVYRPYASVYTNPYVYHQPRHYPRCYSTYHRDYYGVHHRRICH